MEIVVEGKYVKPKGGMQYTPSQIRQLAIQANPNLKKKYAEQPQAEAKPQQ